MCATLCFNLLLLEGNRFLLSLPLPAWAREPHHDRTLWGGWCPCGEPKKHTIIHLDIPGDGTSSHMILFTIHHHSLSDIPYQGDCGELAPFRERHQYTPDTESCSK